MAKLTKNHLIILGIICLAVLSCIKLPQQYTWDVTQNKTNTLTSTSKTLLDALDAPLTITVYSPDMELLNICDTVLAMFKKYSSKVNISMMQTILDPSQSAKFKVTSDHVLVVEFKDAQQAIDIRLNELSEQHISSLIQRVINDTNHWLVFLTGHQEADPLDSGEFGLSGFAQMFTQQGLRMGLLNLAQQQFIPQNTSLLVIANPQQDFLPNEKALLHQYLNNGGRLIWFTEPNAPITAFLAEEFGLKPAKGVAIDPQSLTLGSPHPALKIITQYPTHAITQDLTSATILPWSGHLQILFQANDWDQQTFLTTSSDTWTYNGPTTTDLKILRKYQEITGPLNLGVALSRPSHDAQQEQRALVIADSSFVINKYLPLYANKQLATNMVSWAQNQATVLVFNTPVLKDLSYYPSKLDAIMSRYVFTLLVPMFLVAVGFYIGRNWPKLQFRFKIHR